MIIMKIIKGKIQLKYLNIINNNKNRNRFNNKKNKKIKR